MFERLLEKIATALNKAEIPYMVIGGQAVLLYGEPLLTKGIDITLGVDLENLSKVIDMVKSIDLQQWLMRKRFLVKPWSFLVKIPLLRLGWVSFFFFPLWTASNGACPESKNGRHGSSLCFSGRCHYPQNHCRTAPGP